MPGQAAAYRAGTPVSAAGFLADVARLADRLPPGGAAVTRPARGAPMGGELDYLDDGTLAQALKARRPL